MHASADELRRERIATVLELAAQRVPTAQQASIETFAREYFRQVDPDDLEARSPEDLLGAMLSHWQFGATRAPGAAKVQVLSPTIAENGWDSRHSVIDIVNDDMPFLVDTATMEINRQGLSMHLIVHPIFAVTRDAAGHLVSLAAPGATGASKSPASAAAAQNLNGESAGTQRESWMHIEVDRLVDPEQRAQLLAGIEGVLADVRAAVTD